MMYKDHSKEALGGLISKMTQEGMADQSKLKRIPIENLVANPKNFYHVRDVEKLAGLIAVSHHVDPLVVMQQDDGTYMIVSGHRRTAAWKLLLEQGMVSDHTLPCFVWQFKDLHIPQEGSEDIVLPADTAMTIFLIAMNAGQRERSIDEQLEEIRMMEPVARTLYRQMKQSGTMSKGALFREFFAKNFLNISSSALQRKLSLLRLTEQARRALDEKILAKTSASLLVQMTPEEQNAYIDGLRAGTYIGTNAEIMALLHPEKEPAAEEGASVEPASDGEELPDTMPQEPEKAPESPTPEDMEIDEPAEEAVRQGQEPIDYEEGEKREIEQQEPGTPEPLDTEGFDGAIAPAKAAKPKKNELVISFDKPKSTDNPQEEAQHWFQGIIEGILEHAEAEQEQAEASGDHLVALQWNVRIAIAKVQLEMLH
ncbi:ParB N-terminal domain-containing protein [uncultured Mitsuokella sp.]|uniref:ParB/RepB/Spo0J family partition protein n=1 Tax=uncultured Mitsuokella sp. TaxID=453120 RepID=UPI0026DC7999|nr:ParB N-terminal domain-containing protein [uncultured Mitsuokella sp.]